MLIQLRHHVYIKFDPVSLGPSILFPWPFWPISPFGTSPVLKSILTRLGIGNKSARQKSEEFELDREKIGKKSANTKN